MFVSRHRLLVAFPYYMETYGFHTIHGRAPAVATGIKLANPELDVWIVTGDGDGLSIGGNHTDARAAPQSRLPDPAVQQRDLRPDQGPVFADQPRSARTRPSTPFGSVDRPANPCAFALGSGARFVARGFDVSKNLPDVLKAAHAHQGAAFVEIFQNCIVYNKDVFDDFTAPKGAEDQPAVARATAQPMLFAERRPRASRSTRDELLRSKVVDVVDGDWQAAGRDRARRDQPRARAYAGRNAVRRVPDGAGRALRRSAPDLRERRDRTERHRPAKARTPTSPSCSPRARPGRSAARRRIRFKQLSTKGFPTRRLPALMSGRTANPVCA